MFKTTLAAIEQAYQRQCDDVQGEADKVIAAVKKKAAQRREYLKQARKAQRKACAEMYAKRMHEEKARKLNTGAFTPEEAEKIVRNKSYDMQRALNARAEDMATAAPIFDIKGICCQFTIGHTNVEFNVTVPLSEGMQRALQPF